MGRPPCCDKAGIKKGPWTPEEDIILVSYIQEHGPGNWRSVPTNTGLLRCSKSCRLRWTNYLRPGIKRGNFTPHEEGMIIHLQASLGNKWAAIASYLPQRTDNDIKNYWNTHLKKKLRKFQSDLGNNERSNLDLFAPIPENLSNQTCIYASSTENISRLLEGWMRSSPKNTTGGFRAPKPQNDQNNCTDLQKHLLWQPLKTEQKGLEGHNDSEVLIDGFDSILSLERFNEGLWAEDDHKQREVRDQPAGKSNDVHMEEEEEEEKKRMKDGDDNNDNHIAPPLTLIEKWLLDEANNGQMEEMSQLMEISNML